LIHLDGKSIDPFQEFAQQNFQADDVAFLCLQLLARLEQLERCSRALSSWSASSSFYLLSFSETSIAFDGKHMAVTDYMGYQAGMPLSVADLEDAIDHLAGPETWTGR
jgi:hypothetical protein